MNDAAENPNMPKLPAEIFDGYAVYEALSPAAKLRTSPENVADTLDALAKVMRRNAGVPTSEAPSAEVVAFRIRTTNPLGKWRYFDGDTVFLSGDDEEVEFLTRAPIDGVIVPAPAGWWTQELEKIFNASNGDTITLDMKRAANIALKIARGERWDDEKQEWTAGVDVPRPPTAQEDRWLRDAAKRSSTLVAPGKLADGVTGTFNDQGEKA